jgi:hypothetical protein
MGKLMGSASPERARLRAALLGIGAVAIFGARRFVDLPGKFLGIWGVEHTGALLWHEPALVNDQVASSVFAHDTATASTWLTYILIYKLGLSAESVYVGLSIVEIAIAAVAMHVIGARVSGSPYGGCFVVATYFLAPDSWFAHSGIGYMINFGAGYYPGQFGVALGLAAIALWLSGRMLPTAVFVGLFANYHPTVAGIIGVPVVLDVLYQARRHRAFALVCVAGMVLPAMPAIIHVMTVALQPMPGIDWSAWWTWLELRKWFHLVPWIDTTWLGRLASLTAVYVCLLFLATRDRLVEPAILVRMILLLGVALAFVLLQFVLIKIVQWPLAAGLFLSRLTVFLFPVAAALAFAFFAAQWKRRGPAAVFGISLVGLLLLLPRGALSDQVFLTVLLIGTILHLAVSDSAGSRDWLVIAALPVWAVMRYVLSPNVLGPVPLWPLSRFGLFFDAGWLAIYSVPAIIVIILGFLSRWLARSAPVSTARVWAPLVIGLAGVGIFNNVWLFKPSEAGERANAVRDLEAWAASNTTPGSVFLTHPNFPCADFCLGRLVLLTWAMMGNSIYAPRSFPAEELALKMEYGIDLHDRSTVSELRKDLVDDVYRRFGSLTDAQLTALRAAVPAVRYVVSERTEAGAGRFAPVLNFPIVHENEWYRVYDAAGSKEP